MSNLTRIQPQVSLIIN